MPDSKVGAKKKIVAHSQSVCATGCGKGVPEPTQVKNWIKKMAGVIGKTILNAVVPEDECDTDTGPHEAAEDSGI